jgi:long-subunit fatty acid transport protein
MRLRDTFTRNPQNIFDTDETLSWVPVNRLRLTAHYHQDNLINGFTPYYSLYGDVSYHEHHEGVRLEYELPHDFDAEVYYKRSGITRSNSFLWPQEYSIDNTDLLTVMPSSFSNTTGLALRYHNQDHWSARAGYEWTGTHDPGYLIVPQSIPRRDRFYYETLSGTFPVLPDWNLGLGYSYQQNKSADVYGLPKRSGR